MPTCSAVGSAVGDERFWALVDRSGECWEWYGYRDRQGYGHVMREGHNHLAHRYAFALAFGPAHGVVRHSCDNPPCCNPAHLLDGTQADNIADRQVRGRHRPGHLGGEAHSQAKLTLAQVREIRSRTLHHGDIKKWAAEFDVHRSTIERIVHGQGWKEVA